MKPVHVLNGPNLGRLGGREPAIYGSASYADLVRLCERTAGELGIAVVVEQTDEEATMLGWLHRAHDEAAGVVLNPAAWGHYSYALRDAVAMLGVPVVEVHLSNPQARESFRRRSVTSDLAAGVVAGFGQDSYRLALHGLATLLDR